MLYAKPSKRAPKIALGTVLLFAWAVVPFTGNDYWFNAIFIPFLIMALAGLGLNILMGYAGMPSLGSGAFMATGAYATYNLLLRVPELPLPISLFLAGIITGLVGIIVGLPSMRIKGFYLLAPTLAAQFILEWVFNQYSWFSNHSNSGITAPKLAFLGYELSSPVGRYLLVLSTTTVITFLSWIVLRSQSGRHWQALRDMDTAASVVGIPLYRSRLSAFFVSSMILGIAGALWAFAYLGTVDSRSFNLDRSFQVMFIIIIGGSGSILGSFYGSAFMVLLPFVIEQSASKIFGTAIPAGDLKNLQRAFFGALIIWFLIKEPRGLRAIFNSQWQRLRTRLS